MIAAWTGIEHFADIRQPGKQPRILHHPFVHGDTVARRQVLAVSQHAPIDRRLYGLTFYGLIAGTKRPWPQSKSGHSEPVQKPLCTLDQSVLMHYQNLDWPLSVLS